MHASHHNQMPGEPQLAPWGLLLAGLLALVLAAALAHPARAGAMQPDTPQGSQVTLPGSGPMGIA